MRCWGYAVVITEKVGGCLNSYTSETIEKKPEYNLHGINMALAYSKDYQLFSFSDKGILTNIYLEYEKVALLVKKIDEYFDKLEDITPEVKAMGMFAQILVMNIENG